MISQLSGFKKKDSSDATKQTFNPLKEEVDTFNKRDAIKQLDKSMNIDINVNESDESDMTDDDLDMELEEEEVEDIDLNEPVL